MITHTLPRMVIDTFKQNKLSDPHTEKYNDPVANYLDEVLRRMIWGYKHWYCGHFHEDKTINHYNLTIMYNKVIELI